MVDQSSALRYGRTQASPFRRFYDAKRAFDVGLAKQGRRQHALGLRRLLVARKACQM